MKELIISQECTRRACYSSLYSTPCLLSFIKKKDEARWKQEWLRCCFHCIAYGSKTHFKIDKFLLLSVESIVRSLLFQRKKEQWWNSGHVYLEIENRQRTRKKNLVEKKEENKYLLRRQGRFGINVYHCLIDLTYRHAQEK